MRPPAGVRSYQSLIDRSLILDFPKGLAGKGEVRGSVTSTPEDVLHLYPNADALLPRISVFVVECKLVEQDATLNAGSET